MHLWLAPFTPRGKHTITVTFVDSLRIAMIRIWVRNISHHHAGHNDFTIYTVLAAAEFQKTFIFAFVVLSNHGGNRVISNLSFGASVLIYLQQNIYFVVLEHCPTKTDVCILGLTYTGGLMPYAQLLINKQQNPSANS